MARRHLALLVLALVNAGAFAVTEVSAGSGTSSPAPVVAVVDTGVSTRPELAGRLLPGIDLVRAGGDATDASGHGTAVATLVARACASCTILPVRVLSRRGGAPWARVAAGILAAVDRGANVVNVSIAGPKGSPELRAAVAYAAARGVTVVAAAGNSGDGRLLYPAAYPSVVSVAATDGTGHLADWSTRGASVDVLAPGCPVRPANTCGTSFAAPLVAAAAAQGESLTLPLAQAADPS